MSKPVIAFVFPGQGAQSVGMGQDFVQNSPLAADIFNTFDSVMGEPLSQVCFNGPEETLKRTLYTQPGILATSLAAHALFKQQCPEMSPVVTAGHSLGEYGALVAAGAMDVAMAAKLIQKRASLMEEAAPGAMSAVLGLDADAIRPVLHDYVAQNPSAVVTIANDNCPGQIVISGDKTAVASVEGALKEAGAKRVIPLPVGGAFHSPLMSPAAAEFATFIAEYTFTEPAVPVVTNVDARATTSGMACRDKLAQQIDHSVLWTDTMKTMVTEYGVDTVIEFGPGNVLCGLFKKLDRSLTTYAVNDMASLQATIEAMNAACVPA